MISDSHFFFICAFDAVHFTFAFYDFNLEIYFFRDLLSGRTELIPEFIYVIIIIVQVVLH